MFNRGLDALAALGARVVPCDTGDIFAYGGDEFTVLLMEFKVQIAEYLAGLSHTSLRNLSDLIAFNLSHCSQEMRCRTTDRSCSKYPIRPAAT